MYSKVLESFNRLLNYCIREGFRGYDPYDGLNSKFFRAIPVVRNSRLARLAWIQLFKRLPVNARPLFGIEKDYNPKALGLFLSGYCALYKADQRPEYLQKINFFIKKIFDTVTPGYSGACWGYNFDWQARAFFQPRYTPTVVASTFVANSLLNAFDLFYDKNLLDTARSTCNFILKDLNRTYDQNGNFSFSYSAEDHSVVYNASLLGSKLLARVYRLTGEEMLLKEAERSVRFCCEAQNEDGSWTYGKLPFHQWIDNFHTGYNLECISDFMKYTGTKHFRKHVEKGYRFYVENFFTEEGIPKYYNNSVYPVDVHAAAQLIITLISVNKFFEKRELADRVLGWTIDNMQSEKGYFYYQKNKYFHSKIPYMRWSQAWMFYAMARYLSLTKKHEQIV